MNTQDIVSAVTALFMVGMIWLRTRVQHSQLPPAGPREVVFSCAAGGRSLTAARQRMALGQPAAHLAGGISQWKAEGLPVVRIDPRTGRPV